MIKTKIVITVGPACSDEAAVAAMIDAGVDVFRLNFSHGSLDAHGQALERIRRIAAEKGRFVAVMGDLSGPKIRVGNIEGGQCRLETGQQLLIQREQVLGTPERISCTYPELVDEARVGERLLIDDGNIRLRILGKRPDALICRVEVGGLVSDRKGLNLPDTDISAPALTEKDVVDLDWAIANDLDFIAMSFVRRAADLYALRDILRRRRSRMHIVSKIEKPQALRELDEVISASDVVLVARGDLGVEMDVSQVPMIQKEIVLKCRRAARPVIIATQMLQSMVDSPVPTRAEVSDVANAILDGGDAVMLSAETAVGSYSLEAVRTIARVAHQTETFKHRHRETMRRDSERALPTLTSIVHGASVVAHQLNARLVAVWSERGDSARLMSKEQLEQPIIGLSADERVCRQMAVMYGVLPMRLERPADPSGLLVALDAQLVERKLAQVEDLVVLVAGTSMNDPGVTNMIFVHRVGQGNVSMSFVHGLNAPAAQAP